MEVFVTWQMTSLNYCTVTRNVHFGMSSVDSLAVRDVYAKHCVLVKQIDYDARATCDPGKHNKIGHENLEKSGRVENIP